MESVVNFIIGLGALILILFLLGYPIYWLLFKPNNKPRNSKSLKKKELTDYPQDRGDQTNLPFDEWCKRNRKSIRKRRTNRDLWNFCYETGRPTFEDWKEIHGFGRAEWVKDRLVYENWLKYIGAYNPNFDPSSPEYDGGDNNFVQRDI